MKKIKYCYRNYHLGTLTYENNVYVYNSNFEIEKQALDKVVKMQFYTLLNSRNNTSNTLFSEFDNFKDTLNRTDLVEKAKIKQTDSEFEKLYKLAHLNFPKDDFYITV